MPEIIPFLTPSSFVMYRKCALKEVLSKAPEYKEYIYLHPKTRLGSVCHQIINNLGQGKYDHVLLEDLSKCMEKDFEMLCKKQFEMANQSVYSEKANSYEHWPGYFIKLSRLKIVGEKLWRSRKQTKTSSSRQFVEQYINSPDGKLRGRPDRYIFVSPNELLIEDYKTGLIFDEKNKLYENIRLQMMLYASIFHETYPDFTIRFRIIPLKGMPYEETVDIDCANKVFQDAMVLLHNLNEVIEGIKDSTNSYDDLASPSLESCEYCLYKFRCNSFFESNLQDLLFHTIKGTILSIEQKDQYLEIVLSVDSISNIVIIRRLTIEKHIILRSVSRSTSIILTELEKVFENDDKTIYQPTIKTLSWSAE